MKFNLEKLRKIATPLSEKEREQIEYQIENQDWLLLSVRLALKIRSLMASGGISQSELARRMGVSPAQVTKILSGKENLGLKTIAKVEAALGKPLFQVDLGSEAHEVVIKEKVEYVPVPVFVKNEPIKKRVSSTFSSFDVVSNIAYS